MAKLQQAAGDVGVHFTFDENGNIANYTREMTDLYNQLAIMEAAAGDEWTESEKDQIDSLKDKIAVLEDAQQAYEETLNLIEDLNLELDELNGKPPLPVVTSELVDIYKEVNDELDDIDEKIDEIDKKTERLTGADKVRALKQGAKYEKERLATLKEEQKIIKKDINETQAALLKRGKDNGLNFKFDSEGNISNFNEQMKKLTDNYKDIYDQLAADGGISEQDQVILDALQDDIDELSELADAYTEASEKLDQNKIDQEEALNAWYEKNAEALTVTLECELKINERDLHQIEYEINKLGDDFYSMAEAAALMSGGQYKNYVDELKDYEGQLVRVAEALKNGEIGPAQYEAALEEIYDGIYKKLYRNQIKL